MPTQCDSDCPSVSWGTTAVQSWAWWAHMQYMFRALSSPGQMFRVNLVCRVAYPHRFLRLKSTSETVNYAFRKDLISQSPSRYYPTINQARNSARVLRVPDFIAKYKHTDLASESVRAELEKVQLEGKVTSIRKAGKGLYFIDIVQDNSKVQIYSSNKPLGISKEEFSTTHTFIRKGDHICCTGHAYRTNVGELSLRATLPVAVASPCLNSVTLPDKLSDRKLINSNRVMNYLVDKTSKDRILVKSSIVQALRSFFLKDDYVEVQTPILSGAGTGANAEPFYTVSKALHGTKLQLRVAPELWLKKLVIGGFDKVFEIGMNFRNEGIDATHNPEFLTCEFYRSFTSLQELMVITEDLFRYVYKELEAKNYTLLEKQLPNLAPIKDGNYPKFEFIPTIEQKTGKEFPSTLDSESLLAYYSQIGVPAPAQKQPSYLLDHLSAVFLESISEQNPNTPIFIYNQPSVMSPLAKSARIQYSGEREYDISLRFELFINGKEFVNSYEEENSPFCQKSKFESQQRNKEEFNDADSLIPDWNYVQSMEYGLPPTGGWGCGIDRLCMLFTGASRIEDVLTFGNVRDVTRQ